MTSFEERVAQAMHKAGGGHEGALSREVARRQQLSGISACDPVRAVGRYFSRFRQFEGRCGRAEFWWAVLIVHGGCVVLFRLLDPQQHGGLWVLLLLASLALLLPLAAAAVRRLHDAGRPGGILLAFLLPTCVSQLVVLVFLLQDAADDNVYGPATA